MKTAMKLTTGILATVMMAGGAWATEPGRHRQRAQHRKVAAAEAGQRLERGPGGETGSRRSGTRGEAGRDSRNEAGSGGEASFGVRDNQLQRVNVVPNGDSIEVEISSSRAVTPRVSKLSSPARVVVELPETVVASAQNKIPVGSGGVKGVRIGMDGKTPPTTSVVVDLEKALTYEIAPGTAGKAGSDPAHAGSGSGYGFNRGEEHSSSGCETCRPNEDVAAQPVSTPKVTVAKAEAPKANVAPAKSAAKAACKEGFAQDCGRGQGRAG